MSQLGEKQGTRIQVPFVVLLLLCASLHSGRAASSEGGEVVSWGGGLGPQAQTLDLGEATAIAGGGAHSLAIRADGTVVAWGNNNYGQTNVPAELSNVVAIAAGHSHSLALRADGSVTAWGQNTYGQTDPPPGIAGSLDVAAGREFSLVLLTNKSVVAWGRNDFGQTNLPPDLNNVGSIAAREAHGLALLANGTVVGWGRNDSGQASPPAGLSNAVAIAAGSAHSLALLADGTVSAWGAIVDANGIRGPPSPPIGLSNVVAIAAAAGYSLALRSDGTIVGWGYNSQGQTSVPLWLTNNFAIGANNSRALALTRGPVIAQPPYRAIAVRDSTVRFDSLISGTTPLIRQWLFNGNPIDGATNASLILPQVPMSAAGNYAVRASNAFGVVTSSVAPLRVYRPSGAVIGWGANDYQQATAPVGLSNVVSVACGLTLSLALQGDGTVVGWGNPWPGVNIVPPGLSNVVEIAMGQWHAVALKRDGTVSTWGRPWEAQLNVPTGLSDVSAIAAGLFHTLALKSDGTIVGWGAQGWDQYQYDFGQSNAPGEVNDFVGISTDYDHSLGVRANGTVVAWGNSMMTNVPPEITNIQAVAACNSGMALRSDGAVLSWRPHFPYDTASILLRDTTAIVALADTALALKRDGTVIALKPYGPAPVIRTLTNAWAIAVDSHHGLAVTDWPVILTEPNGVTVPPGGSAAFAVKAAGNPPLQYQWQFNGIDIQDATNSALTLSNRLYSDAGQVTVVVRNDAGAVRSAGAGLEVYGSPVILREPESQTVLSGGTATFTVIADGYHL